MTPHVCVYVCVCVCVAHDLNKLQCMTAPPTQAGGAGRTLLPRHDHVGLPLLPPSWGYQTVNSSPGPRLMAAQPGKKVTASS